MKKRIVFAAIASCILFISNGTYAYQAMGVSSGSYSINSHSTNNIPAVCVQRLEKTPDYTVNFKHVLAGNATVKVDRLNLELSMSEALARGIIRVQGTSLYQTLSIVNPTSYEVTIVVPEAVIFTHIDPERKKVEFKGNDLAEVLALMKKAKPYDHSLQDAIWDNNTRYVTAEYLKKYNSRENEYYSKKEDTSRSLAGAIISMARGTNRSNVNEFSSYLVENHVDSAASMKDPGIRIKGSKVYIGAGLEARFIINTVFDNINSMERYNRKLEEFNSLVNEYNGKMRAYRAGEYSDRESIESWLNSTRERLESLDSYLNSHKDTVRNNVTIDRRFMRFAYGASSENRVSTYVIDYSEGSVHVRVDQNGTVNIRRHPVNGFDFYLTAENLQRGISGSLNILGHGEQVNNELNRKEEKRRTGILLQFGKLLNDVIGKLKLLLVA